MDTNTPTWPVWLPVPRVNPGHTGAGRQLRTEMESGRIRSRRIYEEAQEFLNAEWSFTEDEFEDFKAFFDADIENGSHSFMINLEGEEREMVFSESTYQFARSDNLYSVTAVLEFLSLPATTLTIDIFEVGDIQESDDPVNDYVPGTTTPLTSVTLGISVEEL